jgi:hypothetical protein
LDDAIEAHEVTQHDAHRLHPFVCWILLVADLFVQTGGASEIHRR